MLSLHHRARSARNVWLLSLNLIGKLGGFVMCMYVNVDFLCIGLGKQISDDQVQLICNLQKQILSLQKELFNFEQAESLVPNSDSEDICHKVTRHSTRHSYDVLV